VAEDVRMAMHLAYTDEANDLLSHDPLALLLGMLLDQQIPMEKAFTSPQVLAERMGTERLDARAIAEHDPEDMVELFRRPPALHRFPGSMAKRAQELCRALVDRYDNEAQRVWADAPTGQQLVTRIAGLPGFGDQKARIFAALLAKQFGVQPPGWPEATGDYGMDGYRSVADVVDGESLLKVRAYKKEKKAQAAAGAGG
jgi:uncharacterized HhH-GPD family protein